MLNILNYIISPNIIYEFLAIRWKCVRRKMQVKHIRILTQMGSQFQQRLFYHQLEQLLRTHTKKTKEQLKAGRFATKQMGLGESKEKRKKNDFRQRERSEH